MTLRILVVDDSLTVRMDLKESFEAAGYETALCETAAAARDAVAAEDFAVIVLDLLLPDGDGIELLKEFKSHPRCAATPVMLLSTESEVRDRIRGLATGADEYVGKPYDAAHVVARARELIRATAPFASSSAQADAGVTVMVVDDSETDRRVLRDLLEGAGYGVVTAGSGEEALRLAALRRPAASIIDGRLPGIDGLALIHRFKSDAALRRMRCMLISAAMGDRVEVEGLQAGADVHVLKGGDPAVLLARLAALLRGTGAPQAIEPTSSLVGPQRILAVDDSMTYLNELAEMLREEGYEVVTAGSGEEAIELLGAQGVDGILLDLMMPGLSGHETCRRIKSEAKWRAIPLLMLTAREDREAMLEGFNAGADDYIAKSDDFAILAGRLRAQLRRSHYEEENRRIREELLRREHESLEAYRTREAKDLLQRVLDTLPVGVFILDGNGEIIHVNPAARRIWEGIRFVGREDFCQKKACWADTGRPLDAEEWAASLVLKGGEAVTDQIVEIECFDGTRKVIHNSAFPVIGPDHSMTGAIAVELDITAQRRAEEALKGKNIELARARVQAEKESRFKSRFLASMSHELRTPLNGIIGFSELLDQELFGTLTARQKTYVGNVLASGRHLLDLVNDILDISKVEAGRMELSREWTPLASVVEAAQEIIAPLAAKRLQTLEVDVAAGLPDLHIDPVRIRQVLNNLLSNAVKFTAEGGAIKLTAYEREGRIRVVVQDNGIGIRSEDMTRLFREFERIESASGEKPEGTGLGLVLSRRLAELHGGSILAESEPGKGSTFTLDLPVGSNAAVTRPPVPGDTGPAEALVLVVEDDPQAAELISGHLRAGGLAVCFARNAEEALSVAAKLHPAAITLDILLPRTNGWTVLSRLKDSPETVTIPVVIISVVDEPKRGLILGAADCLVKPVTRTDLLDALSAAGLPVHRVSGLKVLLVGDGADMDLIEQHLRAAGCSVRRTHEVPIDPTGEDGPIQLALIDLRDDPAAAIKMLVRTREESGWTGIPILGMMESPEGVDPHTSRQVQPLARVTALRHDDLVRAVRRAIDSQGVGV
ncbi:MAG TPA: response regulator [Candidatus Polarisedimenticolia bacterium]|jgi:DNA-binding response OmpR family regulator/anti-sigma regulatory factor (Ser/Thr protein kinase)